MFIFFIKIKPESAAANYSSGSSRRITSCRKRRAAYSHGKYAKVSSSCTVAKSYTSIWSQKTCCAWRDVAIALKSSTLGWRDATIRANRCRCFLARPNLWRPRWWISIRSDCLRTCGALVWFVMFCKCVFGYMKCSDILFFLLCTQIVRIVAIHGTNGHWHDDECDTWQIWFRRQCIPVGVSVGHRVHQIPSAQRWNVR